jgi:hypothetical protein
MGAEQQGNDLRLKHMDSWYKGRYQLVCCSDHNELSLFFLETEKWCF